MSSMRVAIVVAEYHHAMTSELLRAATARLAEHGVSLSSQDVTWVPGAVELPIAAQRYALTGRFDAIIVFGVVIEGETAHFTYVCQQVSAGVSQVSLTHNIPVLFGVLTTPSEALTWERLGGNSGHMGIEAADGAVNMVNALRAIDGESAGD